jgi:hypothetical protein
MNVLLLNHVSKLFNMEYIAGNLLPRFAKGIRSKDWVHTVPIAELRMTTGVVLDATGAGSNHKLVKGTNVMYVEGVAAQSNTKTDTSLFEWVVPQEFDPTSTCSVRIRAKIAGTGTAGTKTVDLTAFLAGDAAASGSDLVTTAAQNLTTSYANYDFTFTGSGLAAGDRVLFALTTALQETGGSATVTATIAQVKIILT